MKLINNSVGSGIVTALLAAAALGGMFVYFNSSIKNQDKLNQVVVNQTAQKGLQGEISFALTSSVACKLSIPQDLSQEVIVNSIVHSDGAPRFAAGTEYGRFRLEAMKLKFPTFEPDNGVLKYRKGVLAVKVGLLEREKGVNNSYGGATKVFQIPMFVITKDNKTEFCMSDRGEILSETFEEVCTDGFGAFFNESSTSCTNIYGPTGVFLQQIQKTFCNQAGVACMHPNADQTCVRQDETGVDQLNWVAKGFKADGKLDCVCIPKQCKHPSFSCNGTDLGDNGCGVVCPKGNKTDGECECIDDNWSSWTPDASSQCSDTTFVQTRSCNNPLSPKTQSNTVVGTRVTGCTPAPTECVRGEFSPRAEDICIGQSAATSRSCPDGSNFEAGPVVSGTKTVGNCAPSGGGGGGGSCFVAGTEVTLESGKTKAIEDLLVGDMVRTYDEITGEIVSSPVKEVFHHQKAPKVLYEFTFVNGSRLKSTDDHLLYVEELKNYLPAREVYQAWLQKRAFKLMSEGKSSLTIKNVTQTYEEIQLYNIHVVGRYDIFGSETPINHNYFANGVLVHNVKMIEDENLMNNNLR